MLIMNHSIYTQSVLCHSILIFPPGSCTQFEYQCDNGNCVRGGAVCNDEDNCGDNSDEKQCGEGICNLRHLLHSVMITQ